MCKGNLWPPASRIFRVLMLVVAFCGSAMADSNVAALLRKADHYRLEEAASRVETLVQLYRDEALDKERRYTVYTQTGRRSLVLMKSPSEIGRKVLMLGEHFWLLMPESQRPIRITPSQKLMGEAATGDIASMTWSEDYDGTVVGEVDIEGKRAQRLDLVASRPGVTYARIELYLEVGTALPIKADLFVHSGKRAKEAWYEAARVAGRWRIVGIRMLDDLQPGRRTVLRYLSVEPHAAPDELFNPAALVRNSLAGW